MKEDFTRGTVLVNLVLCFGCLFTILCFRIELNLLNGDSSIGKGQALLHANIRVDEGKIVFNSFLDGKWGKEERIENPFKSGDEFDLRFR